jgi:hypothetical protein
VTWISLLIKKGKKYVCTFPLRRRANRDVSFGASFCFALVFRTLFISHVVKVFISMRAHIFFFDAAKKSLFHFYSQEILYLPSARLSVSLARSRPLSISRVGERCVPTDRARGLVDVVFIRITHAFLCSFHA